LTTNYLAYAHAFHGLNGQNLARII